MQPYVYIMASKPYGTIYVGVTGDLLLRIAVHKDAIVAGFTRRYGVHRLVYYEAHDLITDAIQREHNIKHWSRKWKIELVESINPMWDDLYPQLVG